MILLPKSGLGRFLLGTIALSTLLYLVLNLVSFGGSNWIDAFDWPIRIGLWTVCATNGTQGCSQWSDSAASIAVTTYGLYIDKPSYIRSSQALEIISLIFYVFASLLTLIGILNFKGLPYRIMFIAADVLLFICMVFVSATLGLVSVQGRSPFTASNLRWAWWVGLIGLIMMIICFFSIISFILDMEYSTRNNPARYLNGGGKNPGRQPPPFYPTTGQSTHPIASAPPYQTPSYSTAFPSMPPPSTPELIPYMNSPMAYNDIPAPYDQYANNYPTYADPMANANDYPMFASSYDSSPSPLTSAMLDQYVLATADAQYEQELLAPYQQY